MAGISVILIAILSSAFSQQPQSEKPNVPVPVITIERTGGYAGVEDQVSVFADGKVLDESGKVRHVELAGLKGFIRSVERVAAPALEKAAVPRSQCSDCFMYTIKIPSGEAVRTFVVEEPIGGPSDKESDDAKVIREFMGSVFAQVRHGQRLHIGIVNRTLIYVG